MSAKDDLENRAAAAAAYVLGARAVRRDVGGARVRDFDLRYPDRPDEPLEITRFADPEVMNTWARIERADRSAPSLSRVWTVDIPEKAIGPQGDSAAYDVNRFFDEAEPALALLEQHGHDEFTIGGLYVPDPDIEPALEALRRLGCYFGLSHPVNAGEAGRIHPGAGVGGFVDPDLIAVAVEREANKEDNRDKLREPPGALRRHLFVVADSSAGTAFIAVHHGDVGRLPVLTAPITTALIAASNHVLVATPPGDWELHEIPEEVFDHPENWLIP